MQLLEAQRDLQRAFVGGGPGVFYSGILWLAAGFVFLRSGTDSAFAVLFLGGITIFPVAKLISKFVFRRTGTVPGNPVELLGLESTIAMLAGIFAAWLFLAIEPTYVVPIMAIAVGAHYFAFKTLYGDKRYWVLATLITAVGFAGLYLPVITTAGTLFSVGVVEIIFGVLLAVLAPK